MIEVLTASSTTRLVEVSTLETRLGSPAGVTALLGEIVAEVTSDVEGFLDRPLAHQQYRETTFGTGEPFAFLSRFPVELELDRVTVSLGGSAVTDHQITDPEHGVLWRESGFTRNADPDAVYTYWAGFLLPGQVSTWAASTSFAANAWARPLAGASALRFQVTAGGGGNSGGTEPTWPTAAGGTVVDGALTWTARAASELPAWVSGLAIAEARTRFARRFDPADLASARSGSTSEVYRPPGRSGLTDSVERGFARWRVA